MKKRILALASALVLVAVLVMPMAVFAASDTTGVTGQVAETPTVTSVTPNTGDVNTTPEVTIAGTNFVSGETTVSVTGTAGITPGAVTFVSSEQIKCTFTIAADAAAGARNVYVTVAGKTSTEVVTFTVNAYITVDAPSAIDFGYMTAGGTETSSSTGGSVTTNAASWSVTVKDEKATAKGYMNTEADGSGTSLAAEFQIKKSEAASYTGASTGYTLTQADGTGLSLYVSQEVAAGATAGNYQITITFTGSTG